MPIKRANGQGSVFRYGKHGQWRAAITIGYTTDANGKTKRIMKTKSGFAKKADALAALVELKNTPLGVDKDISFKDLYDKWSKSHFPTITKDTEYCYTAAYAYCKALYRAQFSALKTQDFQAVVDACPLGRRTKQNIKAMLTCMYKYAIQNDYCDKDYAQYIRLPQKEKSSKDAFTLEEREKLWKDYENGEEFTEYILAMIYTGMRYGELTTVLKENVHLAERYLVGGIKTDAGKNRTIPICERVYPVIEKIYNNADNLLVDMPEKVFYNRFYEVLRRCKIRLLKPHCCRHTCATALAEAGVQPAIIQEILGHEDYATTTQYYTHVHLDSMLQGINSIK
jgi:integrase